MLKTGDTVVMHTCLEADSYEGVVWTCRSDEFKHHPKHDYTVVMLEGFSGSFSTEYLRKVDIDDKVLIHCFDCNRRVLSETNGWFIGQDIKHRCKKCHKDHENKTEALKRNEEILDNMRITHTVFKNEDLETVLNENVLYKPAFDVVVAEYQDKRKSNDKYIVINTDEDPRMIQEIIQVMKRYNKWG